MTIRHFRIFIAVYSEKSMTGAAKKLYMTQPSVSQAIKELETHYRTVLFERFPKELLPTRAGEKLYLYANTILSKCVELEDDMKEGSAQHILRIGANDTIGSSILHEYLKSFHTLYPNEEVQVVINKSSLLCDMVHTNELDLLLTDEFRSTPDLTFFSVCEEQFVAVAAANHPLSKKAFVSLEDLNNSKLLLREKGAEIRDYFDSLMNENGFHADAYWESISFDILLSTVKHGEGIALLPKQYVSSDQISNYISILNVPDFQYKQNLILAYKKNKYITPQMSDFISICKTYTDML